MAMTEQDHEIVEKIARVLPKMTEIQKTKLLASAQTLVMIFDQSASEGEGEEEAMPKYDASKPESA